MTGKELPENKRKEYESIVEECMAEMEKTVPEARATFDTRPDVIRQSIFDKYWPRLQAILDDAETD